MVLHYYIIIWYKYLDDNYTRLVIILWNAYYNISSISRVFAKYGLLHAIELHGDISHVGFYVSYKLTFSLGNW